MGRLIQDDRLKRGGLSGLEIIEIRDTDGRLYETTLAEINTDINTEITDIPTAETDTTLVLKPDGAGGVEWGADVGVVLTDGEGTTANVTSVDLGGTLTGDATINIGTHTFNLSKVSGNDTILLSLFQSLGGEGEFKYNHTSGIEGVFGLSQGEIKMAYTNSSAEDNSFSFGSSSGWVLEDEANSRGIVYLLDYSANYTVRSLVDKGYSDSYFTGALTDGAPTNAEIVAILGTAASNGAGYKAVIKDTAGTTLTYHVTCDGTNYYYVVGTLTA